MEEKNKISGRKKILEVLSKNPGGLNTGKIRELVLKERAINEQHLASVVSVLVREGKIKNDGKHECPHCCARSIIYKIRPPMSV